MTIPFLFVQCLSVAVASVVFNTNTTATATAESTLELCGISRPESCSSQATIDVCQCILGYIEQLEPLASRMQCSELLDSLVHACHQSGCSTCSTVSHNSSSWIMIASIAVAVVVVFVIALVVIKLYLQRRRLAARVDRFRAASASRADETRALIYEVPQYPPRV
jgi:hypothetical protein